MALGLGNRGTSVWLGLGVSLLFAACQGRSVEEDDGSSGESGAKAAGGSSGAGHAGATGGSGGVGGASGGGAGRFSVEFGGKPGSAGTGGRPATGGTGGSAIDAGQGGEEPMGAGGSGGARGGGGGRGGMAGNGGSGFGGTAGMGAVSGRGGSAGTGVIGKGGRGGTGGSAGQGGTGGKGGSAGKGGTGGKGGAGGSGGKPETGVFGGECTSNAQCPSGLTCLKSDPGTAEGPAHGLCTLACASSTDCAALAAGSQCVVVGEQDSYCLSGCLTGALGVPKCEERADVACSLAGLMPTSDVCSSSTQCGSGRLCDSSTGTCGEVVTACIPTCGGDYDCGDGRYCDYATGLCSDNAPTRLPLGSLCDPSNDQCQGFCATGATASEGTCSALCTLTASLTGCGWDGSGAADNACLFATLLSGNDVAPGDVGICGKLCDCNADCPAEGDYCVDESGGSVLSIWSRNGYCRELQSGETVDDTFQLCGSARHTGSR